MTPAPTHHTAPAGGSGTYRDQWGIPHLWADSADELAFLQGMNAATDRSWQIELERWRSEGRTAEVLGADAVVWDRFARQARLDDTARRCFENLDAATQRWCGQYVAGINQALTDGHRGGAEFQESGCEPEPWNPWTPLGVFLVHHILFSTFPNKLFRAHVARTLGDDAVSLFSIEAPVWSGSNAWAAHGSTTATGLPLIAGDPHRLMELPGVYQQIRLACPEFDAIGFAFPGVPGLPHFAHTGNTAWAITNAMADYQDLFVEELRRISDTFGERVEARGAEGWEPVVVSSETITVRGGEAVSVEIIETARGPVISETPDGGALSLRFPARVEGRLGFEALLPLLRSRSASEVEAAFDAWVEPVNSVVAADVSGSVRHFVAGLVPQRNPANRRLPAPAFSARHEWEGQYVVLPRTEVQQFAVSANDREAGGGDAVAMEFAPAHRALRIRELLESAPGPLSVDDDAGHPHGHLAGSVAVVPVRALRPGSRGHVRGGQGPAFAFVGVGWPDGCRQPPSSCLCSLAWSHGPAPGSAPCAGPAEGAHRLLPTLRAVVVRGIPHRFRGGDPAGSWLRTWHQRWSGSCRRARRRCVGGVHAERRCLG